MATASLSFKHYFARLPDPRRNHLKRHPLLDVVAIALCGVIAGADDWQEIATFAQGRREWLQTFLHLPNGIPSHDTLERVFDRLDPAVFQACFQRWVAALTQGLGLGHVAIDGKTLRGSGNGPKGCKPLHLVSAWATECRLSLGQVAVEEKSNEITAIPRLLELLDLHGALVTIDAMGCQKEIAAKIVAGGGDYLLALKDNQPTLAAGVATLFEDGLESNFAGMAHRCHETSERGHGRVEQRCYYLLEASKEFLLLHPEWQGLRTLGLVVSERQVGGGPTTSEVRFYVSSMELDAHRFAAAARGHWGIENVLHWSLDVTFREDENRVQKRHGAENLGLLRRLALGLLKRHPSKLSLKCKRLAATIDCGFLEEILAQGCKPEKL